MTWKCENWKWPLVSKSLNISASTWPKLKIKVSFEILRTSRFQNWPSFLNLMKIWGRYCQKTNWEVFSWTPCIYDIWYLWCNMKEGNKLQGVPKKIGILSGFEFLTLGEVFLGVTFYQKTFLFYEIFFGV